MIRFLIAYLAIFMTQLIARQKIKTLVEAGIDSVREIYDRTGIPKSTVFRIKKLIQEGKSIEHKKVTGRPKLITKSHKISLIRTVKYNPRMPIRKIRANLASKYHVTPSTSTVYRTIQSSGFSYKISVTGPFITEATAKKRIEWCKKYKKFDWNKVFFTDECSVWLHRNSV